MLSSYFTSICSTEGFKSGSNSPFMGPIYLTIACDDMTSGVSLLPWAWP